MIAMMVIIYTSIVLVLFKFKLVKPRPLPIACIAVVGILAIGGIAAAWFLCAPMSPKMVTAQYVIDLVPYVKGQVKKIHAQANQPLKKGDLLLEIDPEPYQFTVNQLEASLQAAKETVNQNKAALQAADDNIKKTKDGITQAQANLDQAKATVANAVASLNKAKAQDDLAKTQEQIALNIQKTDAAAISTLKVTEAVQNRAAADAAVSQADAGVTQAQAAQRQAEAGLAGAQSTFQQAQAAARQATFTLKVSESNVPAVQAQLDDARFNLAQCKMYAPADGYVVNWQVQEGVMLVSIPIHPAGTFINTSETFIGAVFPQNYLMNVKPGDKVELVLDPYPGRLFKAEVDNVITATGEGQFKVSGNIPYTAKIGSMGVLAVKIRLTEPQPPNLPLGAGGTVAIYTDHGKPVHIISKVTIRMKKWMLYVFPTVEKPG